jgi:hypothetical protein
VSGRLHIVDDDNLSGARIYEEKVVRLVIAGNHTDVTVLRKHGAVFVNLERAHEYVTLINDRIDKELLP